MQYVNLGNTGPRVSRRCLGMSFGADPERPCALPGADAEPISRRAAEGGIAFFARLEEPYMPHDVSGHE